MFEIQSNRTLKQLTTFKIGGAARAFVEIADGADLPKAFDFADEHKLDVLVFGGGSNMLVSDRGFDGLVIHINNRGIALSDATLRVASGEVWDQVVQYAVDHSLWGIENLSRIPGQAGSVAVQNVGAYGQETSQVLESVDVFDRTTNSFRTLSNAECGFSYRKSIFNTSEKNRYVILSTTLRLSREPKRMLGYPDVLKYFGDNHEPSQQEIRQAIREIRDRKFPFPAESVEGNAGSFFKNSELTEDQFATLEERIARNLPEHLERFQHYKPRTAQAIYKVPSAFIFEACGLKGFRRGDVQLNPTQPVVVLNVTGTATAEEVLTLVREVRSIVEDKTGLHLYTEPELIGFSEAELRGYGFNDAEIARYCP